MPKISAIMPVYNSEKYIAETMDSILGQTYTDFEFLIVNGASTDRTREIIESYKDKRIQLYNLKIDKGVGYASNFAVQKATGRYIARVDADDIYHPDRFLLQKEYLDNNPEIVAVKSLYEYFADEDLDDKERFESMQNFGAESKNKIISPEDISEKLYWNMCLPNNVTMIRAEILKKVYYGEMRCGEDYYLFYNLNKKGYKIGTVTQYLVRQRISNGSITAKYKNECFEAFYIIKSDIIIPLFKKGKVFIWGAGSFGELVNNILKKYFLKVEGYIDSDPQKYGSIIGGFRVFPPKMLRDKGKKKILVASQPGKYAIAKELEAMGYKHIEDYVVFF